MNRLAIRLPPTQGQSLSVTTSAGTASLRNVYVGPGGVPQKGCVEPPGACAAAPSFVDPSQPQSIPKSGNPCQKVQLWGKNLACAGATVTLGGIEATVVDYWGGPDSLLVRLS
jgi:hypothetical protein